jgi:hypothetical protein
VKENTMNESAFRVAYTLPRNGANALIRHPLSRSFIYSDGVREIADLGCHWLLDIIGTEGLMAARKDRDAQEGALIVITLRCHHGGMLISMKSNDDKPAFWNRNVTSTDFPAGDWKLYGQFNGPDLVLILPNEY